MTSREKYLAAQARYNHSEKGRARWRQYQQSEKGQAAEARRVRLNIFGEKFSLPGGKSRPGWEAYWRHFVSLRDERYEQQRAEYRDWRENVLEPQMRETFGA